MSRPCILVVDNHPEDLRLLEVSLKNAGFAVTTAGNGRDALRKVEISRPDLIISETALPEMDGFAFVEAIKRNAEWADIPFLFLSEERAVEAKVRGLELGVDDYLVKPVFVKELIARLRMLLQRRKRESLESRSSKTRFTGSLDDIALVDLIQTIDLSKKTGALRLTRGTEQGVVYFQDGEVVDAELGRHRGTAAVYRLLTWSDGFFDVDFRPVRRGRTVHLSTQEVLMEGMRRLDEWGRLVEQLPPLDTTFMVDAGELIDRLDEIPDDVNAVIRLTDGTRTLLEIIDAAPFDDVETLKIITQLHFYGILVETGRRSVPPARTGFAYAKEVLDLPEAAAPRVLDSLGPLTEPADRPAPATARLRPAVAPSAVSPAAAVPVVSEAPPVESPSAAVPVVAEASVVESPVEAVPVVSEAPPVESPSAAVPVVAEVPVAESEGSVSSEAASSPEGESRRGGRSGRKRPASIPTLRIPAAAPGAAGAAVAEAPGDGGAVPKEGGGGGSAGSPIRELEFKLPPLPPPPGVSLPPTPVSEGDVVGERVEGPPASEPVETASPPPGPESLPTLPAPPPASATAPQPRTLRLAPPPEVTGRPPVPVADAPSPVSIPEGARPPTTLAQVPKPTTLRLAPSSRVPTEAPVPSEETAAAAESGVPLAAVGVESAAVAPPPAADAEVTSPAVPVPSTPSAEELDALAARFESPFLRTEPTVSVPPPPPGFRLASGETPAPGVLRRDADTGEIRAEGEVAEPETSADEGDGIEFVTRDEEPKVIVDLPKEEPAGRPSVRPSFDPGPEPRRGAGGVIFGVVLALLVIAGGVYLFVRPGTGGGSGDAGEPGATPDARVATADTAAPAVDAGSFGPAEAAEPPPADAGWAPTEVVEPPVADAAAGEAAPPAEAGAEAAWDAAGPVDAAVEPTADVPFDAAPADVTVEPEAAAPPAGCGSVVDEAKALWRGRDREGAVARLIAGFGCADEALAAGRQAAQWVSENGPLARALAGSTADALGTVTAAFPNDGQLWFFYVDLLYKAGRRVEADAAKARCLEIRPRNEYASSCRFLPQ